MTPSTWSEAIIVPILKTKTSDPRVPLNYRGISLLSCISNLFGELLNRRLCNYLEHNQLIVDEQNGFRKNRSCMDHIFVLHSIVKNRLNFGNDTFAAFILDLKKAFDSVQRDLLLY